METVEVGRGGVGSQELVPREEWGLYSSNWKGPSYPATVLNLG